MNIKRVAKIVGIGGVGALALVALWAMKSSVFRAPSVANAATPTSTVQVGLNVYGYQVMVTGAPGGAFQGPIVDASNNAINSADYNTGTPHKIYLNANSFSVDFRVGLQICQTDGTQCHTAWTPWASQVAAGSVSGYSPIAGGGPLNGTWSKSGCPSTNAATLHNRLGDIFVAVQTQALPPGTQLNNVSLSLFPLEYDYSVPVDNATALDPATCWDPYSAVSAAGYTSGGWSGGAFDKWNNASTDGFVISLSAAAQQYDAQFFSTNIPSTMTVGQSITTGTDGNPVEITMQNTGATAWYPDKSSVISGVGTCTAQQQVTSGNDCPALTDAPGTTCTSQVDNYSDQFVLLHTAGVFGVTINPAQLHILSTNTCTVGPGGCSNPNPACQTQAACGSTGFCSAGGCATQGACMTPTQFGGCFIPGVTWTQGCYGRWGPEYEYNVGNSVSVPKGSNGKFLIGTFIAPATANLYTETWTMQYNGSTFGNPANINITVKNSAPTVSSVSVTATPSTISTIDTSTCAGIVTYSDGTTDTNVTYTATGGTITAGGVFTPSGPGAATCTATSVQDNTKSKTAAITVVTPGTAYVSSQNSQTGGGVSASWDAQDTGGAANPQCDTALDSGGTYTGTQKTYNNLPTAYTNPICVLGIPNSAGPTYALKGVERLSSASVARKTSAGFDDLFAFTKNLFLGVANAQTTCGYSGGPGGAPCTSATNWPNLGAWTVAISAAQPSASFVVVWDPIATVSLDQTTWAPVGFVNGSGATFQVKVSNGGAQGSKLTWTATSDSPSWLQPPSPSSDATGLQTTDPPDTVTITVDPTGLSANTYTGHITFTGQSSPYNPTPVGIIKNTLTVTYKVNPKLSVSCNPTTVYTVPNPGDTSTCTANGADASGVTWSSTGGTITAGGNFTAPGTTGSITITAVSNDAPANTAQTVINVMLPVCAPNDASCQPICTPQLTASPASIVVPGTSQLHYSCKGVTTCTITDPNGNLLSSATAVGGVASSSVSVSPGKTTQYTLTCGIAGYSNTKVTNTTVTVGGPGQCEQNPNGVGCPTPH